MPPVEVIYENGVLRPLRPLDLAEGTRLEVTLVKITGPPQPDTAGDHDAILYPKQGRMP